MPYAQYKGVKMRDVPAEYLLWLSDSNKCNRSVRAYITDHWDELCRRGGRDPKARGVKK